MVLCTCSESNSGTLVIFGEITITDVAELKALFLQHLHSKEAVQLDLLNVTKLDTSGVQLMLALRRAAAELGKPVHWLGYSLAVEEVLNLLNLAEELGGPAAVVWS